MSAKRLNITDTTGTVKGSINVRYEKMDRDQAPEIEHRVKDMVVKNRTVHDGVILLEGMTQKVWADEKGVIYDRSEVKHFYQGEEVTEKSQTKVFEIVGYQPLTNYTDNYVIDKYYEVFPDDDSETKDWARNRAEDKNLAGMRLLWEHLHTTQSVARGEFCVSSSGFISTDGYIRAVAFGPKWGLEIGIFKEEKLYKHLSIVVPNGESSDTKPILPKIGIKRI